MNVKVFSGTFFFLVVFLILSVSFFYFGTYRNWPYKIEADGKYYYQYLVSAVEDHDIDFTNNYRTRKYPWMVMDIDHYQLGKVTDPHTGKPINYWTTGPAILWLPFFALAQVAAKIMALFGHRPDMNPFGLYLQYFTMFSAVVYVTTALLMVHRVNIRYHTATSSRLSIWLVLFMTPLYYYTIFEPSLSHVYDFFTFTLVLYLALSLRKTSGSLPFIGFGLACALHVLVRSQNIVSVGILAGLLFLEALYREGYDRRLLSRYTISGAALAVGLLPILAVNNYLFGSPFTVPQGAGFLLWHDPQIIPMLFSGRNGFFSHHPIYLIGLVGFLVALARGKFDRVTVFAGLALVFVAQVYINSVVEDWWAGHSFGQRRLLFSLPLFVFGLSYLLDGFRKHRAGVYKFVMPVLAGSGTVLWIYLTMIHVFIWDYNKPHDIYRWMFEHAPKILNDYYGFFR